MNVKRLLLIACALCCSVAVKGQTAETARIVTFRFVPAEDMFYIPWGGNGAELERLYALIDEYRSEIDSGKMPVYVDGYCASLPAPWENIRTAFIRANRVKSELITHKELVEDNFITKNFTTAYTAPDGTSHRDMVVVTLRIPAKEEPKPETRPEPEPEVQPKPEPEPPVAEEPAPVVKKQPEAVPVTERPARYSRWSIGANVGLPFFSGDMTSLAADKTYIGISAGVQGTWQASPLLGITLSLDWAQNKAGSRGYAEDYLLDGEGMTWYTPQPATTQAYSDLYTRINMFSAGLHLDFNMNRLFGPRAAAGRFVVIVSPAVYAQHFSSKVYTASDDKVYVGDRLSKDVSVGLGGDLALRYAVSPAVDIQLKGTGIWITDNDFDNIRTVGHVKQNAMWGMSTGVVWKIGVGKNADLLRRKK